MSELMGQYANESKALKEQIMEICYHMKGGIDYNQAWGMSFDDREVAIRVINKKLREQNPGAKEYM